MDFVHGCEREGLENYFHECNIASTNKLLAALNEHHGTPAPKIEEKAKRKIWFEIIEEIRLDASVDPLPPSVATIKSAVCKYFDLTPTELMGDRRTVRVVRPRQIGMYLARTLTTKSLPEIGRRFGGRDHSTILHGARRIEQLLPLDWMLAHDVAYLEAALS